MYSRSAFGMSHRLRRWGGLAAIFAALAVQSGCGGGDSGTATPVIPIKIVGGAYTGRAYTANNLPLTIAKKGDVNLSVAATGAVAATLVISDAAPAMQSRAAGNRGVDPGLLNGTYLFNGLLTGPDGSFRALLNSGAGASDSVTGTLPLVPSQSGGTLTITLHGLKYGPFTFNAPPGSSPPGGSGPTYDIAVITSLPSGSGSISTTAGGLNDLGQVVGASYENDRPHPYVWDAQSGTREIVIPNLKDGGAGSINNVGQIAGTFTPKNGDAYHPHAFLGSAAGAQDIGLPAGLTGINLAGLTEDGQVIGDAFQVEDLAHNMPGASDTVSFYDGAFHSIGLGGFKRILGFNRSGVVVGDAGDKTTVTKVWKYAGRVSSELPVDTFANIGYYGNTAGNGLGPNGEILSRIKSTDHAAIFNGGSVIDLGIVGLVTGLNLKGEAIGIANEQPFYWTQKSGVK